jgi:hypothetical protein
MGSAPLAGPALADRTWRDEGRRGPSPKDGKGDAMIASAKTSRRPQGRWRTRAVLTAVAGAGLATALVTGAASAGAATAAAAPAAGTAPGGLYIGNELFMAYTGSDHTVQVKNLASGVTFNVGGNVISAPSLATDGTGRVLIFGRGSDSALWYKSCTETGTCSAWVSLGGTVTAKPGAVYTTAGDYNVYARGGNGAVWFRSHTASGWGPWRSFGGNVLAGTGPAAAETSSGPYVLVAGTNKQLYIAGPGVVPFSPAGGQSTASPGLAYTAAPSGGQPALVGVATGTNHVGYYHRFLSNSPGWHSMGGNFNSGLTVAGLTGTTTTTTLGLGSNNQVYAGTQSWATYPPKLFSWIPES